MYRDAQEALEALERELLAQEDTAPEPEAQEDAQPQNDWYSDIQLDQSLFEPEPVAYPNYANNFGRDLHAYNADHTEEDVEQFSRRVQQEPKENLTGLKVLAMLLTTALVVVILMIFLKIRGVI